MRATEANPYYLLPTSVCRVGRHGCQILISDTTVSRHHADLTVCDHYVILKDVSRFAQTCVNGNLLSSENRERKCINGDVFVFGGNMQDTFTLEWVPICVFTAWEDFPVLEALVKGIPLISDECVASGARELPLIHVQPANRREMFKGMEFLGDEEISKLVGLCGGTTVSSTCISWVKRPLSKTIIVGCIHSGTLDQILSVPPVDETVVASPFKQKDQVAGPSEWITTHTHDQAATDSCVDRLIGGKRFKKTSSTVQQTVIVLRKTHACTNKPVSEIDEWINASNFT